MADEALIDLGEHIAQSLSQEVTSTEVALGELIVMARAASIQKVLTFLRDDSNCQFKVLCDVTAVDWPQRDPRFDVVYNLLSLKQNLRVRVRVATDEDTPVPTATTVYSGATWFEREVWDLFGIFFSGHPDLRRILTDYGFEGHPLRKDFPLTGYVEVRYSEEQKRVVYEPVSLVQDFRNFDFLSPWEGMTDVMLPGDEKAKEDAVKPTGT